ncbi:unnamed protein product [Allacma fusca]|uniref:Uncharacterized protein n=1 Tax=Allacma fusca TaxID=39272 RepID=A0A8J2JLV0_9HEXA|nr:unnamed protein product [Allacma fusca]
MKSSLKAPVILLLFHFVTNMTAAKIGRGASCDTREVNPKFKSAQDSCDDSKGLTCIDSENPEFSPKGQSSKICDCTEDYYFDSVSQECRIQIGLPCDPDKATQEEETWDNKCPNNGHCSTNLGRYGPAGAQGMCRCNDGLIISSIWFVGGGGTICEDENKLDSVDKGEMNMDYPGNSLSEN